MRQAPEGSRAASYRHHGRSLAALASVGEVEGAGPNAPREDLFRIADSLKALDPDVIISFGGGSTIDATKSAEVLRTLGGGIDDYFGTGLVTKAVTESGKSLTPHVAIQTAASSGAHLTKYSNITDVSTGQKKLIVDEAIVPTRPVFDYEVTYGAPPALTADGALDGIAHSLEVLFGAVGKPFYEKVQEVASTGIGLVADYLPRVIEDLEDVEGREALCLATDLGGYSIMIGGTNGGHLTSFSLVDVTSHGRACALMNPYYTVFFAPAIQEALCIVGITSVRMLIHSFAGTPFGGLLILTLNPLLIVSFPIVKRISSGSISINGLKLFFQSITIKGFCLTIKFLIN